ncbi:MAG: prolyl oligopeptidase family serine peptidase [Candidatus Aminicenantales bacterium]
MIFKKIAAEGFLILVLIISLAFASADEQQIKIFQTGKKIVVDGILDEWEGFDKFPIQLTPEGKRLEPSADISVSAQFTYDARNFYAAIRAKDDLLEFPQRSWRYGDGLYITFLDPTQGNESTRFYTFGFSREGKKEVKILVNRDGKYFPSDTQEVEFKIAADEEAGTINYEIAIPFKNITPLRPFFHQECGLNLIYVDRDHGRRKILQLFPDRNYDTELTKIRKAALAKFINHQPARPECQSLLSASHFFHDENIELRLAVNSPYEASGWKIRYDLSSFSTHSSSTQEMSVRKGMNTFLFFPEKRDYPSGLYDLSLGIMDEKGSLVYTASHSFYVVNRQELERKKAQVEKAKKEHIYFRNTQFRESLPTVEIRFEWIEKYMENESPYADLSSLERWMEELNFLLKNVENGKPALFLPGRVGTLAHRSQIDGTLQPYSVFVPEDYTGARPVPLFVTLHGSGVDEEKTIISVARAYLETRMRKRVARMIILAPRARGLSDWYTGNSGQDVIECINHLKNLYMIDERKIVIDGFSMGGYGAWRLSLLHPEIFEAAVIRSGAVSPPEYVKGENVLDLIEKGKNKQFFIVHGLKDNSIPVEEAREAVQKLKELGIKHRYIELKKAGHGNYNVWKDIFLWLTGILKSETFR